MADKPLPIVNDAAARSAVLVKLEQPQFKAIERLVVLATNISDNLYNITGFMGAQLTSLRETEEALKAMAPNEAAQLEANREKDKKPGELKEKKNPFQKLIDFFEGLINILIPFIVGFFIGLKKEFGLIAALVLVFRKQIFAVLKELPKVIAFMAGFLKTAIGNAINSLTKAFKGLAAKFPSISGKVAQLASRLINEFRGVLVAYSSQIERITKVFSGGKFAKVVDAVLDAFRQVGKFFTMIGKIAGMAGKGGSIVTKAIEGLSKFFSAGAKAAGVVGKMLGAVGRFLGPIGAVISTVMALFKGISQAFKGFDEEGVFGAIKGFTSGIISGLVGWIGDLGTWLLSKLLGMLGFDELAAKIGEFDFTGFLNDSIAGAFDTVKGFFGNMIQAIPNIFSGFIDNITNAFAKIFSGDDIVGGILDLLAAVPQMLIDLVIAPFEALGEAIKEVFDFDFAALAKKFLIALAPPDSVLGKLLGTGKMEREVQESDAKMAKQKEEKEKERQKKENAKPEKKQDGKQITPPSEAQKKAGAPIAAPQQKGGKQLTAPIFNKVGEPSTTVQPAPQQGQAAAMQPAAAPGAQQPKPVTMTPVAQQPAAGQALANESQRVAGAGGAAGGSSSQSVVAPVTTTNVNQSSSQNISMPASATPMFGMQASFFGPSTPSFGF